MKRLLCILVIAAVCLLAAQVTFGQEGGMENIKLLPYPRQIGWGEGSLNVGPASYVITDPSDTTAVTQGSLDSYLPDSGASMTVRLGSAEEGYDTSWLSSGQNGFLSSSGTSDEAYILKIDDSGVTLVGKTRWAMLGGVQTLNQLVRGTETANGQWQIKTSLPHLTILDWPDMPWRCLSPQMTWYSGYNRLEGYDTGNWTLDEWKWLVDWSLLHKYNCWALVLCGYWPMTLPGHESQTLDVDSYFYNPATGQKEPRRFTHRNIQNEFLPELIQYANARGIKIYMYSAINSFNGLYWKTNPEMSAAGAVELLPFGPGVHEYWDAFLRRLLESGFNGFVFENPEAHHVPNQTQQCYDTFWAPWASKYGFSGIGDTDQNAPPLGVHVEYYAWLIRTWDQMIQAHAQQMGIPTPVDMFIISHYLMSRIMVESADDTERKYWFDLVDEKIGRDMQFIVTESNEAKYVELIGGDRVASLGGRGGSCTCAMRRIASINNNWVAGAMGASGGYERGCQEHIFEGGGRGAMGYVFEWTNTEAF